MAGNFDGVGTCMLCQMTSPREKNDSASQILQISPQNQCCWVHHHSSIENTKFDLSRTIIGIICLFVHVIYSSDVYIICSGRIITSPKYLTVDNVDRKVEFTLLDGGEGGKHNGCGFVEMFRIRVMQDAFSLQRYYLTESQEITSPVFPCQLIWHFGTKQEFTI